MNYLPYGMAILTSMYIYMYKDVIGLMEFLGFTLSESNFIFYSVAVMLVITVVLLFIIVNLEIVDAKYR